MATAAELRLTTHQYQNALGILTATRKRNLPVKVGYIAIETVLDEAGMRIIASANVPASQHYPHDLLSWTPDGLGHDHASMGMYQQQTGYAWCPAGYGRAMNQTTIDTPNGWGTPAELMNAEISTGKFIDELVRHDWPHMSNWAAAQAVQGSAYSDGSNYRQQDARAQQIANSLWALANPEEDADMSTIIYADKKLYPVGKWPGYFEKAGLIPKHITTPARLAALRAIGTPVKKVTPAQLTALMGGVAA